MPWLEKDKVLLIHVPRCGGTSLSNHHRVGPKAWAKMSLPFKLALMVFFYRYRLLENANFPLVTYENAFALFQFTLASILVGFFPYLPFPYVMWCTAFTLFFNSTFVWTAPIGMRVGWIRRLMSFMSDPVFCGAGGDTEYLVGTNRHGYLLHLTAEQCIRFGYSTDEQIKECAFSIVRNPYSRVVSMYEYNKLGVFESFESFVESFHAKCMKTYHEKHQTDSNHVYCHVIPMHCYTHRDGKQIVNTVIKQEHIKKLVATKWQGSNIPLKIQEALTGIPHANGRKKKAPWQKYYNQKTVDLVLEMYKQDFEIFGYPLHIPGRDDLKFPEAVPVATPVVHASTEVPEVVEVKAEHQIPIAESLVNRATVRANSVPFVEKPVMSAGEGTAETPEVKKPASKPFLVREDIADRRRSASAFVLKTAVA